MAMNEDQPAPSGGDWFDTQGPPPPVDTFAQQLATLYAKYGRSAPTAEELAAHRGNPGGLGAVEAMLKSANGGVTPGEASAPSGRTDRAAIAAKVAQWAAMPGADPSLGANPDYWVGRILETGGLGSDNEKYWQDAGVGPTAFFNNPGRETTNRYGAQAGFGAPPAPYQSSGAAPTFEAPEKPAALSTPYVAPTWQGGEYKTPDKPLSLQSEFQAPTMADLESSAGYLTRLAAQNRTLERGAASKGTILNGGTQRRLGEEAQNFAANEYGNLFNQRVTQRGIADSEYGADVANAGNQFGTNFGVFQTGVSNGLAARQQNAGEYQADVNNAQQSFSNRYGSYLNENARTLSDYLTNYNIGHTADTDYWNRLKDVSGSGLDAAKNGRPS